MDRVIEFSFKRLPCFENCHAYPVAGRPDEIFVASSRKEVLLGIRSGQMTVHEDYQVAVLNYLTQTAHLMSLQRFLALDIQFETLPVRGFDDYPALNYGGKPAAHVYVAPIQREGNRLVATLSSDSVKKETSTFGMPSPIPFMGRSKWFEKEKIYNGTLYLEVFDLDYSVEPVVQLQKNYRNLRRLPYISEIATWAQGSLQPLLMVISQANHRKSVPARILLIRQN
jgi:hypothetical protein